MKDYEEVYNEFWKSIVENEDGSLNLDQVKRELSDYKYLIKQVSTVYCDLVGLSKTHYDAATILTRVYDKYLNKEFALDDLLEMAEKGKVDVNNIKEYLR